MNAPRMTRAHFNFIADVVGPTLGFASQAHEIADHLQATNPKFDREKFIERTIKAWEVRNPLPELDDEIPY